MIYVASDIHGCLNEYETLLEKIQLSDRDTLYILGDVVDRGPHVAEVLQRMMMQPNVVPILGNHEFLALQCLSFLGDDIMECSMSDLEEEQIDLLSDWIEDGAASTLRGLDSLSADARRQILKYLRAMKLYEEITVGTEEYLLVHSGLANFAPDRLISSYEPQEFLYDRPSIGQEYFADKKLVFGHTPVQVLRAKAGLNPESTILRWNNQIAIDCGCVFSGTLGCLCLDTQKEFYV